MGKGVYGVDRFCVSSFFVTCFLHHTHSDSNSTPLTCTKVNLLLLTVELNLLAQKVQSVFLTSDYNKWSAKLKRRGGNLEMSRAVRITVDTRSLKRIHISWTILASNQITHRIHRRCSRSAAAWGARRYPGSTGFSCSRPALRCPPVPTPCGLWAERTAAPWAGLKLSGSDNTGGNWGPAACTRRLLGLKNTQNRHTIRHFARKFSTLSFFIFYSS